MDHAVILTPNELERFKADVVNSICTRLEQRFKAEPDKPMTSADAAKYLSLHPTTLLQKCRAGVIRGTKRGGWYFLKSDLDEYLKGKKK